MMAYQSARLVWLLSVLSLHVLASAEKDIVGDDAKQEDVPYIARASLEPDPVQRPIKSKGCSREFAFVASPGGNSKRIKLQSGRTIRITLPRNYEHGTPAPLILALHDREMTAVEMERTSMLSSEAYNKEAIVIYPEAKDRWQADAKPPPLVDDRDFVTEILDKLEERLCIDKDRVYAAGLGIGAGMVQLLACSRLSSRIAAFSLVNGNIFAELIPPSSHSIQNPTTRMWDQCVAYRSTVRLQAIHSENNTVFDYWGDNRYQGRLRKGVVENLVDWANRNKCGEGVTEPEPWRHSEDAIHKTLLQQGYIFEGFVEEGAVVKASYHCWPADYGKFQQQDTELNEDGSLKDPPPMPKVHDLRTEEEKSEDFIHQVQRNMLQEHYYVRNTGHGWHRIRKIRTEDDARRKAERSPLGYSQALPVWTQMSEKPDYDPDTSFHKVAYSAFDHGFLEPTELESRSPGFDTTARVLQFFRNYRLSDASPRAPRNAEGLTESEDYMVDMLAQQVSDTLKMQGDTLKMQGDSVVGDVSVSVADHPEDEEHEVPIIDLGEFSKPVLDTIRRQKDEL